jgi:hypothetical protein
LRDQLIIVSWLLLCYQVAFLAMGTLVLGAFLLAAAYQDGAAEAGDMARAFLTPLAILGPLGLFGPHLLSCVGFFRSAEARRRVVYRVDEETIFVSDDSGVELSIPWRLVRKATTRWGMLFLKLETRLWRTLPARAFAPVDFARVVARAEAAASAVAR